MGDRLLFLSNGPKRISIARLDQRFESLGLDVDLHWAYENEFPDSLDGYAGIFLSGSPHGAYEDVPFIHREHGLIQEASAKGIPMLGICFGSQILASALCGRDQVFRRSTCEVAYKDLDVTAHAKGDPVAGALGATVNMFVWHNDEVRGDHPDMRVIATSDECPNHIWRFRDTPAWGIQGHPEVTQAQARQWFEESRPRFEADGADVAELQRSATEATEAKTMLSRFAAFVQN
jgi:GMP synthase (glutamine-hydrolysing)